MKVAIVTAGSPDYQDLANVTNPSKIAYAQKHGYAFFAFEFPKERGDAMKRDCYNELWGKGFDVMVWIDQDALIMNSEWAIEWFVQKYMAYEQDGELKWFRHFLWSYDHAGPNSGVYVVAFTSEARHFMDRAYATMLENGLADETAMEMTMIAQPFSDWVVVIPGTELNAYDYRYYGWDSYTHEINAYTPGCFILHMPGHPNEVRIPELARRAAEAT